MAPISTPLRHLIDSILQFPAYAFSWTIGLIVAILTDLHVTSLTVASVAIGIAANSVSFGIASFFVLYVISRIVANLADAVGHGLNNNARAIINK